MTHLDKGTDSPRKERFLPPGGKIILLACVTAFACITLDCSGPTSEDDRSNIVACAIEDARTAQGNGIDVDTLTVGEVISSFVIDCDLGPEDRPRHDFTSDFYASIAAQVQQEV
jgi:hypothetical protein